MNRMRQDKTSSRVSVGSEAAGYRCVETFQLKVSTNPEAEFQSVSDEQTSLHTIDNLYMYDQMIGCSCKYFPEKKMAMVTYCFNLNQSPIYEYE